MSIDDVLNSYQTIMDAMEKTREPGPPDIIDEKLQNLKDGSNIDETLSFLHEMTTSQRGFKDIYVEGFTIEEWYKLINNLKQSIEKFRSERLKIKNDSE